MAESEVSARLPSILEAVGVSPLSSLAVGRGGSQSLEATVSPGSWPLHSQHWCAVLMPQGSPTSRLRLLPSSSALKGARGDIGPLG